MQILFLILILSTAMLLGNEFSIAVFIHPGLARADHERYIPAIQVFAALLGKVMPFWMGATLLLHLVILALTWHWPAASTVTLAAATLLWLVIIIFSVVGPVPINNRVKAWNPDRLPPDWREQRQRWDHLNAIRVVLIALAFLALVISYRTL
jgi:uncharacterized membrane protein